MQKIFITQILHFLNHLIKLNEESSAALKTLENFRIQISLFPFNITETFKISEQQFVLAENNESHFHPPADLILTGRPSHFIKTFFQFIHKKNLNHAPIKIQGDMEKALLLMKCFHYHPSDVIEIISKVFGDIPAYYFEKAWGTFTTTISMTTQYLKEDIRDYLQDETNYLITPAEHKHFCQTVDELRFAIDRLTARIHRLDEISKNKEISL